MKKKEADPFRIVQSQKNASSLSSDEIREIYKTHWIMYSRGLTHYNYSHKGRERIVNHSIDSVKAVQWAWRVFKLRPKILAQRVWNFVRNDGIPNDKKFLRITPCKIRVPDD
ncbi:hypothetical protein RclHR1_13220005 [Rhizophagus clarus]|uniref:Uncharacterized protein n=1 Tax=Rhizophagus clarus TaxID=94130 RepID=A0A2Z6QPI5_9GLOM|nr:hypothetical protein RclHR1_13220005 [Rhizophagus clarus]GES83935.1 hypothetical protein GLOIN_2v1489014 [Rhizophagus clarus]